MMNDAIGLLCVLAPLVLAGLALLWLLFGAADDLRSLFLRWLDRK